jgi:hypothetical protein
MTTLEKQQLKLQTLLVEFLNSTHRGSWIETSLAQIYVRKSHRSMGGSMYRCLDIANITIKEKLRGIGIFTRFLTFAEQANTQDLLMVENVIGSQAFVHFFEKRKYYVRVEEGDDSDGSPSFFYIGK